MAEDIYAGIPLTPMHSSSGPNYEDGEDDHPHPLLRRVQEYREEEMEAFDSKEVRVCCVSILLVFSLISFCSCH